MSRVITFSRNFPAYHPKKGQPTFFVEKIWDSIGLPDKAHLLPDEFLNFIRRKSDFVWPKHHTIRSGNRWKAGDKFSPRVWSGKPYQSPQIIIAPDIEIKKIWEFTIKDENILVNGAMQDSYLLNEIATNDGLEYNDLLKWFQFPKSFIGQIICWNESINY